MQKKIIISAFIVLLFGAFYYSFLYEERFEMGAEGMISASDFDEKYSVINIDIDVHKKKYDKLHIYHSIDLSDGDLKYEIYNPNNELVDSRQVDSNGIYSEIKQYKPIKGIWKVVYYINSKTNGKYSVIMSSN